MSSSKPIISVLIEHVNRDYERKDGVQNWQNLPEIPSAEEILGPVHRSLDNYYGDDNGPCDSKDKHESNLPHNIIHKPWDSIEDYIGAHYQLLREDAVAPLRQAVSLYRCQPTMKDSQDVLIYTHIHIIGMTFSNLGPAPRIEFSYERAGKRIRWQQSKRLQQGTIVALTPTRDKFKTTCKVAIVAARPLQGVEQNPPQIDLFWGDLKEADFNPLEEYVMIEARSGYFEASRHMLVAMQKLMTESFPLSDHLVFLNKPIGAPTFVERQRFANLKSLKPDSKAEDTQVDIDQFLIEADNSLDSVDILGQWPTVSGSKLDESQLIALRRILTKKLAVVQGPPGTGKTFVSISALSVILDNLRPGDPPIIVAAQTNHALDQLLKLIAPVEPKFLRLGGRTSEDNIVVKERTLYEVRNKTRFGGGHLRRNYKIAKIALEASSRELEMNVKKAFDQSEDEAKILLEWKVISQDQFNSLNDDDWISAQDPELPLGVIAPWLGREQLAPPPRCPPINIGFGEEEDLEFEALEEEEVETSKKDDDDIDMLNGKWFPFEELYTGVASPGYSDKKLKKMLDSRDNLWEVPPTARGELYRYLRRRLKAKILEVFRNEVVNYHRHARSVKIARWESDATLIEQLGIKLIGCTTTGLSKYRGLLASLQPRTMLIEEAAETLEGTVIAAMFDSLQQLILVGDHQQLQAHCNITALEQAPYNLAVSMFERLVNNGIEYTMLNKQRRMISEIRELLDPFYPNLQDHSSVLDRVKIRKPIPGMGGRDSYFFHHQWPESRDDFLSRFNIHEANMITSFFTYLVLNGIEPSQITVLTFYSGQRKILLQRLRRQPELIQHGPKFNVFTADSYQGEENDVILLSLVRSNPHHSIGFLENKNRAVVSLSRARRGLYIFGNSVNLLAANTQSFKLWSTVTNRLRKQQRLDIYSGLPIVCKNHQTETMIREPVDWEQLAGGCSLKCNGQLPCGHPCVYKCHPFSHEDILCKEPCRTMLPCGHGCSERCGDECRCACDIIPPLKIVASKVQDELWQPSLDDVLGDSPTKSGRESLKKLSGLSNTPGTSASDSVESSPRKWREWDAGKADKALREIQAARDHPATSATKSFPVLNNKHYRVTVKNGSRIKVANGVAITLLEGEKSSPTYHSPPPCEPIESVKDPGKWGHRKNPVVTKDSKTENKPEVPDFEVVTNITPWKLSNSTVSPLQLIPVSSSTTKLSMRLSIQDELASPTKILNLYHLEAVNEDQVSDAIGDSMAKKNSFNVFSELQTPVNDEEDLISFE